MEDEPKLSDTTKAEMEAGRKQLKENQMAHETAMRKRAEEEGAAVLDGDEAQKAVDEAKPLEKEPTGRKVKSERI